jgi:hypothetical protein
MSNIFVTPDIRNLRAAWKYFNHVVKLVSTYDNFWDEPDPANNDPEARVCVLCREPINLDFATLKQHACEHWSQLKLSTRAAALAGAYDLAFELENTSLDRTEP